MALQATRYRRALVLPALGLSLLTLQDPTNIRDGARPEGRVATSAAEVQPGPPDTLRGTDADDVLRGSERDDLLVGGAGDDRLAGRGGNDVLRGGLGRDVLDGGDGSDVLEGGEGDDVLDGADGRDWLFGEAGDDRLRGGPGPDVLDGGAGSDELHGGQDDDGLDGGEGDDVVEGDDGDDTMDGGDGFDMLDGGAGNDNLDGGDENDILLGGAGVDTLQGADGDDILDGGGDADVLMGDDGADVLRGGAGNDALGGRDGNDVVDGGLGDDLLNGGEGNDVLSGGAGADTAIGFAGDDHVRGGAGNDIIRGGFGHDVVDGDEGDDVIMGGSGVDVTAAGDGNDVIVLRAGDVDSARVETIDGGTNADTARVEADSLMLDGFQPTDVQLVNEGGIQAWRITDPLTRGLYSVTRVEHVAYLQVFPYLAAEGVSALQLVNPSTTQAANGRVEFTAAAGDTLAVAVPGDSTRSKHSLAVPPLGSAELVVEAPGRSGAFRVYTDRPLVGVLRTQLTGGAGGAVVGSPLSDAFKVPVTINRQEGATSGFAVANDAVATSLKVTLYTAAGNEVEAREVDLPSRGQLVVFAHDLFPRFAAFEGALLVEGGPMAVAALQGAPGADVSTAAVVPVLPRATGGPFRFPYVVNGNGHATEIMLVGLPPDSAREGRVMFFDEAGKAVALDLVGMGPVTEVAFAVASNGVVAFATTGQGPLVQGSAVVIVGRGQVAPLARLTQPRHRRLEVRPAQAVRGFVAPVRRHADQDITTLVALGAGEAPVIVELALHDSAGRQLRGAEARVRLPANGRTAVPLEQLFRRADLVSFRGALVATVEGGTAAVTLLELGRRSGEAVALPIFARQ